jgi:hypothetical protein
LEDEAVDWREPALVRVELIALSVKSGLVGVVLDGSLAHHILISLRNQRDQEVDQNDCYHELEHDPDSPNGPYNNVRHPVFLME